MVNQDFPSGPVVKNLLAVPEMQEKWVRSLDWEDPLEKEMAIHSNILAQRIPWTEETGRLWSIGLQNLDTTEATQHVQRQVLGSYRWKEH